ncbi:hypothetical protein PLEOSDRAFT_152334 [Pleurotus ostreatus PC15]|uniref:Uncharacterized protein n=1 Tax=Pleurotus ostreatus (strain PC15) TaxID=1137138 RepID=A0A067P123_PLEO1|nr:hypothetical protein PLEOSDRAFT_152334 [Pleurotus ostreatus PC15]
MALLPRQDKDTAISATSETAFRSGGIKLRGADIALICIFAVLLCFTIMYLVLYRDPTSATRRLRKFPSDYFRNPFRSYAAGSGAQPPSSSASTDVKSPDMRDVERFPRPTFLLGEPSDLLGHRGQTRLSKWCPKQSEPKSGSTVSTVHHGGLLPAVAGNSSETDAKTRPRLSANITSLPPAYLSFPAGVRS